MSVGTVSKSKRSLKRSFPQLGKPLIIIEEKPNPHGGKPNHIITIADIWPENITRFSRFSRKQTQSQSASANSRNKPAASSYESTASANEMKNEPTKEGTSEEERPPPHKRLMDFLEKRIGPVPEPGRERAAIKWLLTNGYDPATCEACLVALESEMWRTNAVTWVTVKNQIGAWSRRRRNGTSTSEAFRETASQRNVRNIEESVNWIRENSEPDYSAEPSGSVAAGA
jgi:hypothetical protein